MIKGNALYIFVMLSTEKKKLMNVNLLIIYILKHATEKVIY